MAAGLSRRFSGGSLAPRAIQRGILVGPSLYALGALLCLVSTWSIGFIVLAQPYYAIAPRFGPASLNLR